MPKTCLIIPCYNEADRLDILPFENFLSAAKNFSICFADDGSTDDTRNVLHSFQSKFPGRVFLVTQDINRGKAEIVRAGVNAMYALSEFDYLGYFDADLSSPLSEAFSLVNFLDSHSNCQVVFGSRISKTGAVIRKNYLRHFAGRLFSSMVNYYFNISLYDTQCGAKIFRKEIAPLAFDEAFLSRWLCDIEIILRLRKSFDDGDAFVSEYPLKTWINKKGSKIKLADLLKLPGELISIKKKYNH